MKTTYLALLCGFLSIGSGRGQQLRGAYRLEPPKGRLRLGLALFWFDNGRFIEIVRGCIPPADTSLERGTYTRKGNRLVLRYSQWEQPPSTFAGVAKRAGAASDSLDITVLDALTRLPIAYAIVENRLHPTAKLYADSIGHIRQARPTALALADSLIIACDFNCRTDYIPLRIQLQATAGQRLTVLLAPRVYRTPSGQLQEFIIRQLTHSSLALQWAGTPLITHYLRVPKESARHLLHASE
ncbi:MAG: hypothetical protein ACRYFX_20350 [Janthinobacterium lividum]